MKKSFILGVLSLSIIGAGCQSQQQQNRLPASHSWEADVQRLSSHEPVVFSGGHTSLSPSEKKKIQALVDNARPDMRLYARLQADRPTNPQSRKLTDRRLGCLKKYLKDLGIQAEDIDLVYLDSGVPAHQAHANKILVILDQYQVRPPECPDWIPMNTNVPSQGEERFGCVTARNLAQMVANPRDLYRGQQLTQGDGPYLVGGITRLRENKQKPLKIEKVIKQ